MGDTINCFRTSPLDELLAALSVPCDISSPFRCLPVPPKTTPHVLKTVFLSYDRTAAAQLPSQGSSKASDSLATACRISHWLLPALTPSTLMITCAFCDTFTDVFALGDTTHCFLEQTHSYELQSFTLFISHLSPVQGPQVASILSFTSVLCLG